jgi:5-methylcytosine-specific restriction endonuclease McrA
MKRARSKIRPALIARIRHQARYRCGYCLSSEILLGMPMEVEHLIPLAIGGTSTEENLWLACRRCNGFKGAEIEATDSLSQQLAALFNPRTQSWQDHFQWSEDGTQIVGLTLCGRATVLALNLNNREISAARRLWVSVGWWPPSD